MKPVYGMMGGGGLLVLVYLLYTRQMSNLQQEEQEEMERALRRKAEEAEATIEELKQQHDEEIRQIKEKYELQIDELEKRHKAEVVELKKQIDSLKGLKLKQHQMAISHRKEINRLNCSHTNKDSHLVDVMHILLPKEKCEQLMMGWSVQAAIDIRQYNDECILENLYDILEMVKTLGVAHPDSQKELQEAVQGASDNARDSVLRTLANSGICFAQGSDMSWSFAEGGCGSPRSISSGSMGLDKDFGTLLTTSVTFSDKLSPRNHCSPRVSNSSQIIERL